MFIQNAYADANTLSVQESESLPKAPAQIEPNWLTSMAPMLLIFVVFYFLLIRPQEKRKKQQEALVSGVKKGEEVLTSSGVFGTVTRVNDNDNTLELEIAKDVQIKILKNTIADIISRKKELNTVNNKKDKVQSGAKTL